MACIVVCHGARCQEMKSVCVCLSRKIPEIMDVSLTTIPNVSLTAVCSVSDYRSVRRSRRPRVQCVAHMAIASQKSLKKCSVIVAAVSSPFPPERGHETFRAPQIYLDKLSRCGIYMLQERMGMDAYRQRKCVPQQTKDIPEESLPNHFQA